ncbi:MAG: hypothetical protein ACLFSE_00725 [Spirochaetia bacterium]
MIFRGNPAGAKKVTVPVTGTAGSRHSAAIPTGKIALQVVSVLKDNTLLLKYPGGMLRTRIPGPLVNKSLAPGQTLQGSIRRTAGEKHIITFRLPPEPGLAAMLKGAGIPQDSLSSVIARAFFRTGIKLSPELIRRGRELISGDKKKEAYKARLFSLLIDKEIDVNEDVLSLLSTLGERNYDESRREQNDGLRADRPDPEMGTLLKEILAAVKEAACRSDDSSSHPIQVFNHLKGRTGKNQKRHWVLIPFALETPKGRCEGRITMTINPDTGEIGKTAIDAGFSNDRRWFFSVVTDGGKKIIRIAPPGRLGESDTSRIKAGFSKIMSAETDFPGKIDLENDDIIIEERKDLADSFPESISEFNENGLNTTV